MLWLRGPFGVWRHAALSWLLLLSVLALVAADPPRQSNGFTDVVTWDNYTVFLHDHRMFIQ